MRKVLTAGVAFLLMAGSAWCAAKPAPSPAEVTDAAADGTKLTSSRIQLEVMDFSDQYVASLWPVMDEYIAGEADATKRVKAQAFKVQFGSASMTIAASTDPRTNLLDMAVFIAVGKWAVNRYWVPKVFGERADALSGFYAEQDRKVWKLLGEVLTPKQQQNLRALLAEWEEENPAVHEVATVRLRNLEGVRMGDFEAATSAKGILASVQKLLGRVDTSLLYGERVMFFMERTPRILSQQTDLTLSQIAETFPIAAIRPETFPGLSKDWPAQLQASIDHNNALAKDLLPDVRLTLESADHLAATLNSTLGTVQAMVAKAPPLPAVTAEDVSRNLQEVNAALNHLDSTVAGVNQLLEKNPDGASKVVELTKAIDERVDRQMDKVFSRALILLGVFFAGVVLVLCAARMIFSRKAS